MKFSFGPQTFFLRACETLWSAREVASVALSTEREGHDKNVFRASF